MAEALAAIPAAGFAMTGLNFLKDNSTKLNSVKHSVLRFPQLVDNTQREVLRCQADFAAWKKEWNDSNNQPFSDEIYRNQLWGDQYDNISQSKAAVEEHIAHINDHIRRVRDDYSTHTTWRKVLAIHRKVVLKRLAYAFFSQGSLQDELASLNRNLETLRSLCDGRKKAIAGSRSAATPRLLGKLESLSRFGVALFNDLRDREETRDWSLELCHPDDVGHAAEWDRETGLHSVQVQFSFTNVGQARRIVIGFSPSTPLKPTEWASRVIGLTNSDRPGDDKNPLLRHIDHPISNRTKTMRDLFLSDFFTNIRMRKRWEADQAQLLIALANSNMLLWKSLWTERLCTRGLRYAVLENNSCLPVLSVVHDVPNDNAPANNLPPEGCNHQCPKLQNFGLVLAELICCRPFRVCPGDPFRYERRINGGWDPIPVSGIVHLVISESKKSTLGDAIGFCLRSVYADDKDVDFYADYVEKVLHPFKQWVDRIHASGARLKVQHQWWQGAVDGGQEEGGDQGAQEGQQVRPVQPPSLDNGPAEIAVPAPLAVAV